MTNVDSDVRDQLQKKFQG